MLCSVVMESHAQEPVPMKLTKTIPLPGVKGRFDHFAIDAKGRRLFVAALGNNTLEVVDVAAGKHLKSIPGLHKPTGVLYLTEPNQIARWRWTKRTNGSLSLVANRRDSLSSTR